MTHETLRPSFNMFMVLVAGTATFIMTFLTLPHPLVMTGLGLLLGLVLGIMQLKGLQEIGDSIVYAKTAREVRSQLKKTIWGRRYFFALWISVALLLVSRHLMAMKPSSLLAGCFAMIFVQELLTLRLTFRLNRLTDKAS